MDRIIKKFVLIKKERNLKLEKVNQDIDIMDFVSIEVLTRTFRPDRCNCGGRMAYNGSVIACVKCGNYRLDDIKYK